MAASEVAKQAKRNAPGASLPSWFGPHLLAPAIGFFLAWSLVLGLGAAPTWTEWVWGIVFSAFLALASWALARSLFMRSWRATRRMRTLKRLHQDGLLSDAELKGRRDDILKDI